MPDDITSLLTPSARRKLEFEKEKFANDVAKAAVSIAFDDGRDNADEIEINQALNLRRGRKLTNKNILYHTISLLLCCIIPGLLLFISVHYLNQFLLNINPLSIIGLYSSSIAGGATIGVAFYVYIIKPYLDNKY